MSLVLPPVVQALADVGSTGWTRNFHHGSGYLLEHPIGLSVLAQASGSNLWSMRILLGPPDASRFLQHRKYSHSNTYISSNVPRYSPRIRGGCIDGIVSDMMRWIQTWDLGVRQQIAPILEGFLCVQGYTGLYSLLSKPYPTGFVAMLQPVKVYGFREQFPVPNWVLEYLSPKFLELWAAISTPEGCTGSLIPNTRTLVFDLPASAHARMLCIRASRLDAVQMGSLPPTSSTAAP